MIPHSEANYPGHPVHFDSKLICDPATDYLANSGQWALKAHTEVDCNIACTLSQCASGAESLDPASN